MDNERRNGGNMRLLLMMALAIGCGDINGDINVDKEKEATEETETTSIDDVGDPSALRPKNKRLEKNKTKRCQTKRLLRSR